MQQLLACTDDVNLSGENIKSMKEKQALLDTSKEVALGLKKSNQSIYSCLVTRLQGGIII
jgi:hypothetical protein